MKRLFIGVFLFVALVAVFGMPVQAQETDAEAETQTEVADDATLEDLQEIIESLLERVEALTARVAEIADETEQDDSDVEEEGEENDEDVTDAPQIGRPLWVGKRGPEVRELQETLATDPEIYPEGLVTGYYGPLTRAAVARFQAEAGLPETGVAGEDTLERINELLEHGAGNSGVIPPGLLIAPGIQMLLRGEAEIEDPPLPQADEDRPGPPDFVDDLRGDDDEDDNDQDEGDEDNETEDDDSDGTEDESDSDLAELTAATWVWQYTETEDGDTTEPDEAEEGEFTLVFDMDEWSAAAGTDCNDFSGEFTTEDDNLSIDFTTSTLKACEDAYAEVYIEMVESAEEYELQNDSERLRLELENDVEMYFEVE